MFPQYSFSFSILLLQHYRRIRSYTDVRPRKRTIF